MTTTRAPRLFAHLLLLLLGACSASGVAWEPISGEVPGLEAFRGREGFVLVWDDAPLFLDGHAAARQVRVRDLGSGERGQAVSGVVVLKLIGGREGLLEVETLGHFEPGAYCDAQPIPGLERLRLRLFVRPADVARVTTRELVLADDPASPKARLALEPGLLVAPSDDPEGRLAYVRVGPLLLRAPVPADAVGWVFKPRRHLAARDEDRALAPDAVLRLPEGASARRVWSGSSADTRQLLGPARATPWTAPTYVSAVKRHRDGALATVRTTCAELVGVVPFDQVLRAERPAFQASASIATNAGPAWRIRRGARLRWADGRPAGEVAQRLLLAREPQGVADAARLQVWLGEAPAGPVWSKLSPREERRLDLFVAQADIVHTRRAFRVEGLGGLLRALGAGAAALSELPEADTFEATIQARIARRMPQVTRCYERELARAEGELEGRLLLEIALDARGRVDEIVVEEDSIGSATLESCVVEQTLKVRFPRPPGRVPTRFTHPFVFQRGDLGPSD